MLLTYLCEIIRNQKDFVIDRTDEELPRIFFFFFYFFDMLSPENCHVPLTLVTPSYLHIIGPDAMMNNQPAFSSLMFSNATPPSLSSFSRAGDPSSSFQ